MYKVLVFGMTENPGGVESVIINYYRQMDKTKIQCDFLCNFHEPAAYEDELKALGGEVYHITARSADYRRYKRELEQFFSDSQGKYQAIWVNVCSLANIDYLIMAKKYGIPRRIIHSHNSQNMDSRLRGMLHKRNRRRIAEFATDFWACGAEAARWFYSPELLKKAVMIRNAIPVRKMMFDENKRSQYRKKLGWQDCYVIGNVGRLHFQKNQRFTIDVFAETVKRLPEARLILIGQGEDEAQLRAQAESLGLTDKIYFAGVQSDIPGWLSMMDLFLSPSLFEGVSVVALEAQANGIPVLASEGVIPESVRINENFVFYDLEQGAEAWSGKLLQMRELFSREKPDAIRGNFAAAGYDIETETEKLEQLFLCHR